MAASPTISVAVNPDTAIAYPYAPALITASAEVNTFDATVQSVAFDWGDGTPAQVLVLLSAYHEYALAGTYTVLVTVTDTNGLSSSASKQVRIYRENVVPPETPSEVPPRQQHVPLDPRQPAFTLRRPDGSST